MSTGGRPNVQTIEATGKQWKALQLVGVVVPFSELLHAVAPRVENEKAA
jgi:hypothetical protein